MDKTESETESVGQPLQRFLTYRLSRVQAKLNTQAQHILKRQAGLTLAKWRIIALIGAAGQTRPADLASVAALDKGLLSRNLKSLIEERLVLRTSDDKDQRVQILSLTKEGRTVFQATLPHMRARQARLEAALDPAELAALETALQKLERAAEWRGEDA